jgi:hypothetical protein
VRLAAPQLAPAGAKGRSATSPKGEDGQPVRSGDLADQPGLMPMEFLTGVLPGLYRPTVELIAGNGYPLMLEAPANRPTGARMNRPNSPDG